jgi:Amidohydrolase
LFRERILCCFIEDRVGMKLLDEFNVDNVCWESDYPHSDSSWPAAPERMETLLADLDREVVDKLTHRNAMRHYQFDPFSVRSPEQCTVASLRAEAEDVDTVTHVGRLADERDIETWRKMTGTAARSR